MLPLPVTASIRPIAVLNFVLVVQKSAYHLKAEIVKKAQQYSVLLTIKLLLSVVFLGTTVTLFLKTLTTGFSLVHLALV